ncbi:hypothetical protein WJX81_008117 [Elliptochloris bilobata]|uniref:YqaJ viral recombinase domain-containing protein n=1 Tax=Elliptochloris bilobata TaxID=381761 RepID=A0AAW1RBI0_9CHLO
MQAQDAAVLTDVLERRQWEADAKLAAEKENWLESEDDERQAHEQAQREGELHLHFDLDAHKPRCSERPATMCLVQSGGEAFMALGADLFDAVITGVYIGTKAVQDALGCTNLPCGYHGDEVGWQPDIAVGHLTADGGEEPRIDDVKSPWTRLGSAGSATPTGQINQALLSVEEYGASPADLRAMWAAWGPGNVMERTAYKLYKRAGRQRREQGCAMPYGARLHDQHYRPPPPNDR